MRYVLKNGRVISGRKNAEVTDCNVYIQNGRITRIANDDDFDGWDVVDLNHAYVLPGLINMHAHLFGTGRPSKTLGGGGMKDQILAAASTALGKKVLDSVVYSNVLNALNAGTTTLRGVGDFYYSDVRTRDAIKNGRLGRAVRDTTISGFAFQMLQTVDMLSDDMVWSCSGTCGKKQPMPVGMGGPAVKCKVNVAGK